MFYPLQYEQENDRYGIHKDNLNGHRELGLWTKNAIVRGTIVDYFGAPSKVDGEYVGRVWEEGEFRVSHSTAMRKIKEQYTQEFFIQVYDNEDNKRPDLKEFYLHDATFCGKDAIAAAKLFNHRYTAQYDVLFFPNTLVYNSQYGAMYIITDLSTKPKEVHRTQIPTNWLQNTLSTTDRVGRIQCLLNQAKHYANQLYPDIFQDALLPTEWALGMDASTGDNVIDAWWVDLNSNVNEFQYHVFDEVHITYNHNESNISNPKKYAMFATLFIHGTSMIAIRRDSQVWVICPSQAQVDRQIILRVVQRRFPGVGNIEVWLWKDMDDVDTAPVMASLLRICWHECQRDQVVESQLQETLKMKLKQHYKACIEEYGNVIIRYIPGISIVTFCKSLIQKGNKITYVAEDPNIFSLLRLHGPSKETFVENQDLYWKDNNGIHWHIGNHLVWSDVYQQWVCDMIYPINKWTNPNPDKRITGRQDVLKNAYTKGIMDPLYHGSKDGVPNEDDGMLPQAYIDKHKTMYPVPTACINEPIRGVHQNLLLLPFVDQFKRCEEDALCVTTNSNRDVRYYMPFVATQNIDADTPLLWTYAESKPDYPIGYLPLTSLRFRYSFPLLSNKTVDFTGNDCNTYTEDIPNTGICAKHHHALQFYRDIDKDKVVPYVYTHRGNFSTSARRRPYNENEAIYFISRLEFSTLLRIVEPASQTKKATVNVTPIFIYKARKGDQEPQNTIQVVQTSNTHVWYRVEHPRDLSPCEGYVLVYATQHITVDMDELYLPPDRYEKIKIGSKKRVKTT